MKVSPLPSSKPFNRLRTFKPIVGCALLHPTLYGVRENVRHSDYYECFHFKDSFLCEAAQYLPCVKCTVIVLNLGKLLETTDVLHPDPHGYDLLHTTRLEGDLCITGLLRSINCKCSLTVCVCLTACWRYRYALLAGRIDRRRNRFTCNYVASITIHRHRHLFAPFSLEHQRAGRRYRNRLRPAYCWCWCRRSSWR